MFYIMVRLVFPYHDDFYLDLSETSEWFLINGLGCPQPDKDDEVEVLAIVVRTCSGNRVLDFSQCLDDKFKVRFSCSDKK